MDRPGDRRQQYLASQETRGGDVAAIDDGRALPVLVFPARVSLVAQLAEIPEEDIRLAKPKRPRTRRAYQRDVQHFTHTLGIANIDELRQADRKAVIAWERFMREVEHAAASTIRRRIAALSSLYTHLVRHGHAAKNPVTEVERPAINRDEGATLAFSKAQARKLREERRRMDANAIDRVVRKYAGALGLDRGYSTHSMRATFISTALEIGARLEDVQKAAGHRDPSTMQQYDRRENNPEKAASFFTMY